MREDYSIDELMEIFLHHSNTYADDYDKEIKTMQLIQDYEMRPMPFNISNAFYVMAKEINNLKVQIKAEKENFG